MFKLRFNMTFAFFLIENSCLNSLKIVYHMKISKKKKIVVTVETFEGEHFSQAPGVLV